MRKIILNIGLNNNPLTAGIIVDKARQNFGLRPGESLEYKIEDNSMWIDTYEPTLILQFSSPYKLSTLIDKIERFSNVLTQDCIAAKIDGNGILVYRIDYKEERHKFDDELFLTL